MNALYSLKLFTSKVLSEIFCSKVGSCEELGLSSRPKRRFSAGLSTSKIYKIDENLANGQNNLADEHIGFISTIFEENDFYFVLDQNIMLDMIIRRLNYIAAAWTDCNFLGRPVFFFPISPELAKHKSFPAILSKIQSGYLDGCRVSNAVNLEPEKTDFGLGITNFLETSSFSKLPVYDVQEINDFYENDDNRGIRKHAVLTRTISTSDFEENFGPNLGPDLNPILSPNLNTQDLSEFYAQQRKTETKDWHKIRYIAALQKMRATGVMSACTDLLLRQKQVTIGLDEEEFVINKPIGKDELIDKIYQLCGTPHLAFTVVTQEVIIYSVRAFVIFLDKMVCFQMPECVGSSKKHIFA